MISMPELFVIPGTLGMDPAFALQHLSMGLTSFSDKLVLKALARVVFRRYTCQLSV
jgi:hypothetical protein